MFFSGIKKYKSALCEIKSMEGNLLAIGSVADVTVTPAKMFVITTEKKSGNAKQPPFGSPVKISLMQGRKVVILGGYLQKIENNTWNVVDISDVNNLERRGFFRVSIKSNGRLSSGASENSLNQAPARLLDISLSGVRFLSTERHESGNIVKLSGLILVPNQPEFNLSCKIIQRHMEDEKETGFPFMYRCTMEQMEPYEMERLSKALFELQRQLT